MSYEYDLQILNNKIAECLAGNGEYDTLQALRREKTELLDRWHFQKIKSLREEISELETSQANLRETINQLEADKRELALDVELQALKTQKIREAHAEKNYQSHLKSIEFDENRKGLIELKNNLNELIKNKIEETI